MTKIANDDLSKRSTPTYPVAPMTPPKGSGQVSNLAVDAKGQDAAAGNAADSDKKIRAAAKATGNVPPARSGLDETGDTKHRPGAPKAKAAGDDDGTQSALDQAEQDAGARKNKGLTEIQEGEKQLIRNG